MEHKKNRNKLVLKATIFAFVLLIALSACDESNLQIKFPGDVDACADMGRVVIRNGVRAIGQGLREGQPPIKTIGI